MNEHENTSTESNSSAKVGGVRVRVLNVIMIVLACIVAVVFLHAVQKASETFHQFADATGSYIECEQAANEMKEGSNYLTAQIRQFVITHDVEYLDNYFTEANETQRRDKAVAILESYAGGQQARTYLLESATLSNELMSLEFYAGKLVLEGSGQKPNKGADAMEDVALSDADKALSPDDKYAKAMTLVFGDEYQGFVDNIENNVVLCKTSLIDDIRKEQDRSADELDKLLLSQQALTWILLAVAVLIIVMIIVLILRPIREYVANIGENKELPMVGAQELRVMAAEYNSLYEANAKHSDDLRRRAEHDHLTGLYNRGVFESVLQAYNRQNYALMLVDVDYFKGVNDTYGHDVGDLILQKLGKALSVAFRSSDYPCRIGGDEFAVIMTEMTPDLQYVIETKIAAVTSAMADTSDELPAMTLSIGVAFSDENEDFEVIFKHADEALYRVKEAGRNGHGFY